MTTYWLLGEKKPQNQEIHSYDQTNNTSCNIDNPSITFQGPDSPASHSLTHSQSPDRTNEPKERTTPIEILSEKDRIKHEIATFVAKDLINNIDNAVREFRKSQSAHFNSTAKEFNSIPIKEAKPLCNGGDKGLITPTYDKELVISKGKVRDVVNRFNSVVVTGDLKNKAKSLKDED